MYRGNKLYFPSDLSSNGTFMAFHSIITYSCSDSSNGDCSNVFNGKTEFEQSSFWLSKNVNPFFQVDLKYGFLIPSDGVILSCYSDNCLRNFSILGIEKGKTNFQEICHYEVKDQSEFQKKPSLFPCNYKKPLKSIRIENRGPNSSGTNLIALYTFDFYGYYSFGICTIIGKQTSITSSVFFILFAVTFK